MAKHSGGIMRTLSDKWVKKLIDTPETGMGYHIVNIKTKDGRVFKRTIMNCGEMIEDITYPCGTAVKDEDIIEVKV